MKNFVVAIDGPAGSGKSSISKMVAEKMGFIHIDTGAMYRAVTLYALENGAIVDGELNQELLIGLLPKIEISFAFNAERGASDIYVNGELAEDKIRTIEVSNCVSKVSQIRQVREKLVAMQQQMGQHRGVVMDGRDIATVVFPDAELKLFMTADARVRAERRYAELKAKGDEVTFDEVLDNVISRDNADVNREISPLRRADDAIELDNSYMSVEEQMAWFMERYQQIVG